MSKRIMILILPALLLQGSAIGASIGKAAGGVACGSDSALTSRTLPPAVKLVTSACSPYTVSKNDYKLLVTTKAGDADVIINLPDPSTCKDKVYKIQDLTNTPVRSSPAAGGGVKFNQDVTLGYDVKASAGNRFFTGISANWGGLVDPDNSLWGGTTVILRSDGTRWIGVLK